MGRKSIEDKRVQLNRYVAGATTPLLKNLALQLGVSEGEVIDWAVQTLAICESFGPEVVKKKSSIVKTVDQADDVQSGDPIQIVEETVATLAKPKFIAPTNKFHKRG